jgi:predicted transglutaminase-like cysteine proteinase
MAQAKPPTRQRLRALMQEYRLAALAGVLLGWSLSLSLLLSPVQDLRAWDLDRVMVSASAFGPRTLAQARELQQLVERTAVLDEGQRLRRFNDFFNQRIAFVDDMANWGKLDYWASPLESLDRGKGDCEDYAIAKYFSLLATGMPEAKLRLVYVRAMLDGRPQAHMVLAYYAQPEAEPLILDNLNPELKPASARGDLAPVFSFNSEGLWQGVSGSSAGNPVVRLSMWRDALAKIRAEGF